MNFVCMSTNEERSDGPNSFDKTRRNRKLESACLRISEPGATYFPIRPMGVADMHTEGVQLPYVRDFQDSRSRTHYRKDLDASVR